MGRKRKQNVKRHPSGQIAYGKKDENEALLLQRARRLGSYEMAKSEMAEEANALGFLCLKGFISPEQYKALCEFQKLFNSLTSISSNIINEISLELGGKADHIPRPTAKIGSYSLGFRAQNRRDLENLYDNRDKRAEIFEAISHRLSRRELRLLIDLVHFNQVHPSMMDPRLMHTTDRRDVQSGIDTVLEFFSAK